MIYLLLSILTTSSLFVFFKYFERYGISTFQAVVFNYLTASLLGAFINSGSLTADIPAQPWFPFAMVLGLLFISVFNLMAITAQKIGVSVSSVANKMSMIIPVLVAVYLYGDTLSPLKIAGIFTALLAVFFTSARFGRDQVTDAGTAPGFNPVKVLFPLLLFIGSGVLDSLLKFCEAMFLREDTFGLFITVVFGFAFLAGLVVMLLNPAHRKAISAKTVIGGGLLGSVNYFSVLFFLNALQIPTLQSSVTVPVNNIGVVACSTLAAFLIFRERLSSYNWLGIGLSILSILIISFS
jgi:drug/metabolite transporter (DMT)-like permease